MIVESSYWKLPLIESAKKFEELEELCELSERHFVQIEQDIFLGFYTIRKLLDASKITDKLKNKKIVLKSHPNKDKYVTLLNNHKLDEKYDFSVLNSEQRDLWFIASRLIHSYIFQISINDMGIFDGVLFTSDTDKTKKLYWLTSQEIISIFQEVGSNEVTKFEWSIDPESGQETMVAS
ncbi:hypothetical protein CXF85_21050 [Colwellia sp. 75C3]|uniref:hypothetical protein n=1 Tax=Colwellia sp. 75C3 TaxID=888425 RepID=UPI000C31FBFF|nr:hypothetical protein [Colwellia sp. 75C3]PKG80617.1 hypothetical protein CXF85_21050 [Colwellia sp. 75C3]